MRGPRPAEPAEEYRTGNHQLLFWRGGGSQCHCREHMLFGERAAASALSLAVWISR